MKLFRTQNVEPLVDMKDMDTYHGHEWAEGGSLERIQEHAWIERYNYESLLVSEVISQSSEIKTVLEIGSGPGVL
jgi:hypothetical protein